MKYIKTFEKYSVNEIFGLSKKKRHKRHKKEWTHIF